MTTDTIPQPGDIINGKLVGIPRYETVSHLRDLPEALNAQKHYAVDHGAKNARHTIALLNRCVRRLARLVARDGQYISVHFGGLSGRPDAYGVWGITVSLWVARDNRIVHDLELQASGGGVRYVRWRVHGNVAWRGWSRADAVLRAVAREEVRIREARRQKRLAAMSPEAKQLASEIRIAMGADYEGLGWMAIGADQIQTSHDYSLTDRPDWRARLGDIGYDVPGETMLTMNYCQDRLVKRPART